MERSSSEEGLRMFPVRLHSLATLSRNPFYLRERRRAGASAAEDAGFGVIVVGGALTAYLLGGWTFYTIAVVASAAVLFVALTIDATLAGASAYDEERRCGALVLQAAVPLAPSSEAVGRWAGRVHGSLRFWRWLGIALVLWTVAAPRYAPWMLGAWLGALLWVSALAAVTILVASLLPSGELTMGCVWGLGLLTGALAGRDLLVSAGRLGLYLSAEVCTTALLGLLTTTVIALALVTLLVRHRVPHLGFTFPASPSSTPRRHPRRAWLTPLARNPLYAAWCAGGRSDVWLGVIGWGAGMLAALSLGLVCTWVVEKPSSIVGGDATVVSLLFLLALYAGAGGDVGWRAMGRELGGAPWPLLTLTGLTPKQIVDGHFAVAFHALTPAWVLPLPMWLLLGWQVGPAFAALGLLPPLAMASGVVTGIALAASSRRSACIEDLVVLLVVTLLCAGCLGLARDLFSCLEKGSAAASALLVALQAGAIAAVFAVVRRFASAAVGEWMR